MRKVFFVCTTLAILGVAGAYLVVEHVTRHPQGRLGQVVAGAADAGASLNPFTLLGRMAPRLQSGPVACEPAPCPDHAQAPAVARVRKFPKPLGGQPAQAEPEAVEPTEVIQIDPPAEAPEVTDAARELPPPAEESDEPATEVIAPSAPEPSAGPEEEQAPGAAVRMPYAEEDEMPLEQGWLSGIIRELGLETSREQECQDAGDATEPCEEPQQVPPAGQAGEPSHDSPDCHSDMGCPYMGCPYPYSWPPSSAYAPGHKPMKKRHKHQTSGGETAHGQPPAKPAGPSKVDTMEYRPSDGDEHAFEGLVF